MATWIYSEWPFFISQGVEIRQQSDSLCDNKGGFPMRILLSGLLFGLLLGNGVAKAEGGNGFSQTVELQGISFRVSCLNDSSIKHSARCPIRVVDWQCEHSYPLLVKMRSWLRDTWATMSLPWEKVPSYIDFQSTVKLTTTPTPQEGCDRFSTNWFRERPGGFSMLIGLLNTEQSLTLTSKGLPPLTDRPSYKSRLVRGKSAYYW